RQDDNEKPNDEKGLKPEPGRRTPMFVGSYPSPAHQVQNKAGMDQRIGQSPCLETLMRRLHPMPDAYVNEHVDECAPNDHQPDASEKPKGFEEAILSGRPFFLARRSNPSNPVTDQQDCLEDHQAR